MLREIENALAAAVGKRRMRELNETLSLVIGALEAPGDQVR